MEQLSFLFLVLSGVVLFLHSLEGFSKEVQAAGQDTLQRWLGKATANRFSAFLLGAIFTGVVQSSSAVSTLTVALVDSGVLTLRSALAVLLGTNVGTATTAWIVALKLTFIGPVLLVTGGIAGLFKGRARIIGKPVFYLGFIFFSLNLIAQSLEPIRSAPWLLEGLAHANRVWVGVAMGIIATLLVQSSSVVTGLAVLLAQQGILQLPGAVALVIGANIGTTGTALLAGVKLNQAARLGARANLIFNASAAGIILVAFSPYVKLVQFLTASPSQAVAYAHLLMNLLASLVFLLFLSPFHRVLVRNAGPEAAASLTRL